LTASGDKPSTGFGNPCVAGRCPERQRQVGAGISATAASAFPRSRPRPMFIHPSTMSDHRLSGSRTNESSIKRFASSHWPRACAFFVANVRTTADVDDVKLLYHTVRVLGQAKRFAAEVATGRKRARGLLDQLK
jgi:hypothetical protein